MAEDILVLTAGLYDFMQDAEPTLLSRQLAAANGAAERLRTRAEGVPYRALCWVWSPAYFTQRAIGEDEAPAAARLTIPDTPAGRYTVEVWDTHSGQPVATFEAESTDGTLQCELPPFVGDIACKICPAE